MCAVNLDFTQMDVDPMDSGWYAHASLAEHVKERKTNSINQQLPLQQQEQP